jgi:hypothetical protein
MDWLARTNEVWNIFMLEYICLNEDPNPFVTRIFPGLSQRECCSIDRLPYPKTGGLYSAPTSGFGL